MFVDGVIHNLSYHNILINASLELLIHFHLMSIGDSIQYTDPKENHSIILHWNPHFGHKLPYYKAKGISNNGVATNWV